jgi:hypothetical protein
MESTVQLTNALERIDNPILVILLIALAVAVAALWRAYLKATTATYELAVETVGTLKDIANRLDDIEHTVKHGKTN